MHMPRLLKPVSRMMTPPARKRVASRLFLLAAVFLLASSASAQSSNYRFEHWTTDNGLPQNTVRAIVQTRDGYLWMTTFDGLARFDGVRFTVFDKSNTPAINQNRFTALCEDKDGTLWAGTDLGDVISYRNGVFASYTHGEASLNQPIMAFRRDLDDELMILRGSGAFHMRAGKLLAAPSDYTSARVKLYRGGSGAQWTIDSRGVVAVKDGRVTNYPIRFDSAEEVWPSEDSQGNLWLGYKANVYRLRDGQATRYSEMDGLPPRAIHRPQCEDDDGGVWFITNNLQHWGIGVARFKDGRFRFYGSDAGLPNTSYTQIVKDREGSIWVATGVGLYRLRRELITTYSTANGLAHNEVYPLLQTRDGRIWISNRGLSLFRGGKFESHPLNNIKESAQSLWEDRAGRLWLGLASLNRYEGGRVKEVTPQTGMGTIWAIREDRAGAVWAATSSGLFKLESDRIVAHYTTKDGLPNDDVKVIHESVDENGKSVLWLGTWGGLARFSDGKFTSYTPAQGLTGDHVRSIYEDSEGVLWIGTYDDGLSRFHDGRFFNYRTEQGLFNNGVFQILEDRRGYFWMSCNKGIYRVSRRELNELAEGRISRVNSLAFGKEDGMVSSECNGGRQPAGFIAQDGRLWFPTMGGVAVIDPEAAQVNLLPPPVMIESVMLERSQVDFSRGLTVQPGQRDLEIAYTGLSFIKPEQVKFKYMLEGWNQDWVEAGARRTAYFSHVPPGEYTFRVIAANSDGVWNEEGKGLKITVLPPFYRTWWFLSVAGACVAGVVFSVYQYRVTQLERSQEAQQAFSSQLIESQEAERKRIAAELHDSLGQNLLVIKNRALLQAMTLSDEQARTQFHDFSDAVSQSLEEVRTISSDLRPPHLDQLGLRTALVAMIEKVATSSTIRFTHELCEVDGLLPHGDEINFYRIVQESLNNILKHSGATEAAIRIAFYEGHLALTIHDNGRGFNPHGDRRAGAGLGLQGIAERVRILGGTQTIHSAPGQGTTVTVRLDLKDKKL